MWNHSTHPAQHRGKGRRGHREVDRPEQTAPVCVNEQGDGSLSERLHDLHIRSKHADKAIEQGHYIEDSPLCVWLTNTGLSSTAVALTFQEIAMILTDMAQLASAVQDPLTMESKIKSLMAE
jgi:hypothetical protein